MTWAVVLAAGASSRMAGAGPKALLRTASGQTFLERIAEVARAAGAGGVVVVVAPPHDVEIERALPTGVEIARNPAPERGMLSSVQAGVARLPLSATAALVWPVDVPHVEVETVRRIVEAAPGQLVIPTARDATRVRGGHPLRLPRARFDELLSLEPALGLRALVDAKPENVLRLPVEDRFVLVDIDTPDDLAATGK